MNTKKSNLKLVENITDKCYDKEQPDGFHSYGPSSEITSNEDQIALEASNLVASFFVKYPIEKYKLNSVRKYYSDWRQQFNTKPTLQAAISYQARNYFKRYDKTVKKADSLTYQEQMNIFEVIRDERDKVIFSLLFGAALRSAEVCAVKKKHIKIYKGKILIDIPKSKTGTDQQAVVIEQIYIDYILEYIENFNDNELLVFNYLTAKSISPNTLRDRMRKYGVASTHSGRRSMAINCLHRKNMELADVQALLRHENPMTTVTYQKMTNKERLEKLLEEGEELEKIL